MDDDFKLDDETVEKEFTLDDDEEKEKKKLNININPKTIIIVLGCLCLLFFILFLVNASKVSKLNKRINGGIGLPEESVEVLDITNEEVQDLFSTTVGTISNYCHKESAYFTDSKNTIGNLSDENVYGIVMNKIINKDKISGNVSRRTVREEIVKLFGDKYKLEDKTFTTYPQYNYAEESGTYVPTNTGQSYSPVACNLFRIVKAYKSGESLYIYVRVLFAKSERDGIHYYNSYSGSGEITNLERNALGAVLANDYNFSKGGLFEMKYNLDSNNNYIFEYSQPSR